MALVCLPKQGVDAFTKALKDGTIDPFKLNKMTSDERRKVFESIVGKDGAEHVNSQFESKMLLKNQKLAYTSWAKKVAGITPEVKRDMISRIEKLDHVLNPDEKSMFLKDLATSRLGFGVTDKEAKNISDLSHAISDAKAKVKPDGTFANKNDRLAYGMSKVHMENYVNDLKLAGRRAPSKNPAVLVGRGIKGTPGFLTSTLATMDNSYFGRQGVKALLNGRTSGLWAKGFLKSWGDIGRELTRKGSSVDALDLTKADIYSRPNALNGNYDRLGKDAGLGALTEEAFPSHAPEKIPLLGRLFKASEAAYNGGALRMRADLADRFINIAEKQGLNPKNKEDMKGIGTLVGSMTGRGSLGHGVPSNTAGHWLFAPKFLKANFNSLTLHAFDKNATSFTRKEAAKNMFGMIASVGSVLAIAHQLNPKSVELDPRSTHFGKINVFGHWTDITGGQGALLTLAARLLPTTSGGKLGFYSKSSSGNINQENSAKYGTQTGVDTLASFVTGKAAPIPSTIAQLWTGQNYNQQTPSAKNIAQNTLEPISIQNIGQLKDKGNADALGSMILDGLGFSVTSNPGKNAASLPGASRQVQDTLSNAKYSVPTLSPSEYGKNLNSQQYKQFSQDTQNRFIQAVQKARASSEFQGYTPAQQKRSLSNSMTKAKAAALKDMGLKKPKAAKPVKSF